MLDELEACYDALPRPFARIEELGPLRLFVREDSGWPFYARPGATGVPIDVGDVLAVRERQRELGIPEAFEWVPELAPSMTPAAALAGLSVRLCPLLVLDDAALSGGLPAPLGVVTRVLEADSPELAAAEAVAAVGFGAGGTSTGREGPMERDAGAPAVSPGRLAATRAGLESGAVARVIGLLPAHPLLPGALAVGGYQHARSIAEIVGVATLPAARRRGLAGAVTRRLAALALERGLTRVFLSAQDDEVARIYERVGFRRVGTAATAEPPED